jgi:hypothetical protein
MFLCFSKVLAIINSLIRSMPTIYIKSLKNNSLSRCCEIQLSCWSPWLLTKECLLVSIVGYLVSK